MSIIDRLLTYLHHSLKRHALPKKPVSQPETTIEGARRAKIAAVWSENTATRVTAQGGFWMAHPLVQQRLNTLVSGDPAVDTYRRLGSLLTERGFSPPLSRCVSLGCGFGALERHLSSANLIGEIDAYDVATGAIAEARRLADEQGYTGLHYHVVDLEHFEFSRDNLDIVFAHQSVHHIEALEDLFSKVQGALKPGGIFHLHEFVGPTRFQWTDTQLALINTFLDTLPVELRRLPDGRPKPAMVRPTVEAMIAADPSEAIRSKDIVSVLRRYFDIVEHRHLGGALLHMGLSDIAQNFSTTDPDHVKYLSRFMAEEDAAMAAGELESDYDVITAVRA